MANALINQERGLYSARGVRPETVWRQWQVDEKIRETDDVVTFVVQRIDDRLVKTSLPGQYVTRPGADARRRAPAAPVQPDPRRRRRAPPVLGQAGARRRASPTARSRRCCTTRSTWATCSPCRCPSATSCSTTPGARWCSPAPASASPRWPGCCRTWSRPAPRLPITLLHADVDEALVRAAPPGRQRRPGAAATPRCTSGTRRAPAATSRSTGSTPGMMDLDRRRAARRRRVLPVRAAAVHAGGAQRADRTGRAAPRHPVRGVRPRPVAGRSRLARPASETRALVAAT